MIERRLKILILIYLWGALLEDTGLFLMAWLVPDVWFRVFHGAAPASFDIALLRRSAGQWAAFALAQGIALWCWRKNPVWLVIVAGVRFSDLFAQAASRVEIVVTFLALLELIRLNQVRALQRKMFDEIEIAAVAA